MDVSCGNKWLQCERIRVISYVEMWFVVQIRMWQTESVHVVPVILNVSAHESDKKFQGVTSLQTCFPNFKKWRKGISRKVVFSFPYLSSRIEMCRHIINSSGRSCRRTSPHPAVVHELDDCMHHNID